MMKMLAWLILLLVVSGCATENYSPLNLESLNGDKIVFFEQLDRVPKMVMMAPWYEHTGTNVVFEARGIDPTIIIGLIDKLLTVYPEVVKAYGIERMENSVVSRRILFRGYDGTNDLVEIEKIIKAMGGCVENWTPQQTFSK